MKCQKCSTTIDKNTKYCECCGTKILNVKQVNKRKKFYNAEYIENVKCDKGRNLFLLGFFGFDIVISTLVGLFQIPNVWVFVVSPIIYALAIIFCIKGGIFALHLRKRNKPMSGLGTSLVIGGASAMMIVLNMYHVFII